MKNQFGSGKRYNVQHGEVQVYHTRDKNTPHPRKGTAKYHVGTYKTSGRQLPKRYRIKGEL